MEDKVKIEVLNPLTQEYEVTKMENLKVSDVIRMYLYDDPTKYDQYTVTSKPHLNNDGRLCISVYTPEPKYTLHPIHYNGE